MRNTHKLSDQQKIDIVYEYVNNKKTTLEYLSKKYKICPSSVNRILKRRGIPIRNSAGNAEQQRRHSYNQNYFDLIDSEDKAYFLGLLYADGYNYVKKGTVSLSLQERDKNILIKFAECTDSSRPLIKIDSYFKRGTGQIQYRLLFQGKKFSNRLEELGCGNNKSLTLQFPTREQVPDHLMRHFIRGVWDGDGYHGYGKRKYFEIYASLVSSVDFCCELEKLIIDKFKMKINKYIVGKNKKSIRLRLNCRAYIINFLSWMYEDSNFYIQRKYQKYIEIKNINSDIQTRPYSKKAMNNEKFLFSHE